MRKLLPVLALLMCPLPAGADTGLRVDKQSAVILAYHRVGDDANPAANIRIDQFESHMRFLKKEGFTVLPLPEIIAAIRANLDLPDKTVAITFDGAHRSILEHGAPVLRQYDFPYTVFVPALYADSAENDYLTWEQLERLKEQDKATIGLQSNFYTHLNEVSEDDLKRGVNNARARYREKMNAEPALFAYPFGEISLAYRDFIATQGFEAAFGQQSGVASPAADIHALPRFSMTESYGDLDRFETAISALPLPISGLEPSDPFIDTDTPAIGFTLPAALAEREDFECYSNGASALDTQRLGEGRVELRFVEPLIEERVRINCTVPQGTDDPEKPYRWRWFGIMLTQKGVKSLDSDRIE